MRFTLLAALAAAALSAMPALADAPGDGVGRRSYGYRHATPRPYNYARRRHFGGYSGVAPGPAYGGLPPFYDGMGSAASHLWGTPVAMTVYREPYIGRGLIYNTPPTLDVPGPVISARY